MTFGERLKAIRVEKGLTQTGLAERAGLTLQGIGQLERGRREPSWGTVQAVARALGVSCQTFEEAAKDEEAGTPARPRKADAPDVAGQDVAAEATAKKTPRKKGGGK